MGTSKGTPKKVGSKTVKMGVANNRLDFLFRKNCRISRVLNKTIVAKANKVNSSATFMGL